MPSSTEYNKQRKERTRLRNIAIMERYNAIYETERLRYDDCIEKLSKEFFLSAGYVERILHDILKEANDKENENPA